MSDSTIAMGVLETSWDGDMILCICFGCPMSYCQWVLYVLVTVLTDDDDEDMIASFFRL